MNSRIVVGLALLVPVGCGEALPLADEGAADFDFADDGPGEGASEDTPGEADGSPVGDVSSVSAENKALARAFFDRDVVGTLATSCGNCHSEAAASAFTKFLPSAETDYHKTLIVNADYVTDDPMTSYLLLFGAADVPSAVHAGTQFTLEQEELVTSWLRFEAGLEVAPEPTAADDDGEESAEEPEQDPIEVDPDAEPRSLFDATVLSPLRARCAGCHEGGSIGPDLMGQSGEADDYATITSDPRMVGAFNPAGAPILTKGPHSGSGWWSSSEADAVTQWLATEFVERNGGDAPVEAVPVGDLMAAFVGCMTLEDWNMEYNGLQMNDWATRDAENNAECQSCHSDGEFFFAVNDDNETMYNQQRTSYFATSFFTIGTENGAAKVVPAFDKIDRKCAGFDLHPECEGNNALYKGVVQQFYENTMAQMDAGTCGDAAYVDSYVVFEAQDLNLGDAGYIVDPNQGNGEWVRLPDEVDTATIEGVWNAPSGDYLCHAVLVTENDGQPTGALTIGDDTVFSGTYPLGPADFVLYETPRVRLSLSEGDPIRWSGTQNEGAYARWDEFRCLPVQ